MTETERNIPPAKVDPGALATDDHMAHTPPAGGHQPSDGIDRGVANEHLSSPSQGVRPERAPAGTDQAEERLTEPASELADDEAAGGGPDGEEDGGTGPAFEPER